MAEGEREPVNLRALFPDMRLVCECVEEREVCPSGCEYFQRMRGVIREFCGYVDRR